MTVVVPRASSLDLLRMLEAEGQVTPTALQLTEDLAYDQYEALCSYLGSMQDSIGFWIGDAALYGEKAYGERAAQALEAMGRSADALQRYVRVSQKVSPDRRRPGLSWSHHREVAALEPEQQSEWLAKAEDQRWTRRELEAQIRSDADAGPVHVTCPQCGGRGWVEA